MSCSIPSRRDSKFDKNLFTKFFKLDPTLDECNLFFFRLALNPRARYRRMLPRWYKKCGLKTWQNRLDKWERHLEEYDCISDLGVVKPPMFLGSQSAPGGSWLFDSRQAPQEKSSLIRRIELLNGYLTILDTKIGMALSFNSLLFAGVSLFWTWIPAVVDRIPTQKSAIRFLCLSISAHSLWGFLAGPRS